MVNRPILIAVFGIGAIAFVNGVVAKKPITRVLIAMYILLLLLSILDAFGGLLSTLAGAIAMLAFITMLLTQTGDIWAKLAQLTVSNAQRTPAEPPPGTTGAGGGGSKGTFK